MHIIFLITKSDVGGAQKYVTDLAASLPKNKFQTHIAYGGVDIHFLSNAFRSYFFFLNDIAAVIEIVFYLRKHRPDILHLNSSKAGVVGAIAAKVYNVGCSVFGVRRPKVKVIFTAHGWVFNPENRYGWLKQRLYILFHKFAALFQDAIINVSEYDRELALRYHIAPAKKLFTIHNGINTNAINFLDKDSAREALVAKLVEQNPSLVASGYSLVANHWVGSVGRLVREKNYETLIAAAAAFMKNESAIRASASSSAHPHNVHFFIIGEGYERPKLETLIKARGLQDAFFLLGAIPDATRYLNAFDVFVMPSIKEGLPYTLLEAMAARLPIVATRTGGMTEILEPQNGIIVPPRDASAIAGAIKKLLANPALKQTLGTNAKAYTQKELALERMTQKTTAVYRSMCE